MGLDWDELTRLGLYDPAAPDADERRTLLQRYADRGVPVDEMVAAQANGVLVTLLGDRQVRPDRDTYTLAELAAQLDMDVESAMAAMTAAGLPAVDADQRSFGAQDLDLLAGFRLAADLFGMDALLHFVRAMGMAASHLAAGAIHLSLANYSGPLEAAGAGELELSEANESAVYALEAIPAAFEIVFRHHVEHELRRSILSAGEPGTPTATLAVGFLDLVGFTSVSSGLAAEELADAVAAFETLAGDLVTAHGARLVKVIGDEVMFVTHVPEAACALATEVVAAVEAHPALTDARGGITYGPVLTLDGDYYGTGVNLAARAVAAAEPGQVLVDRGLAVAVPDRAFASVGERELKGFPDPVELFALPGG
jgi:class 3 adenylate cyclase